jgi:hypothetical protein
MVRYYGPPNVEGKVWPSIPNGKIRSGRIVVKRNSKKAFCPKRRADVSESKKVSEENLSSGMFRSGPD